MKRIGLEVGALGAAVGRLRGRALAHAAVAARAARTRLVATAAMRGVALDVDAGGAAHVGAPARARLAHVSWTLRTDARDVGSGVFVGLPVAVVVLAVADFGM